AADAAGADPVSAGAARIGRVLAGDSCGGSPLPLGTGAVRCGRRAGRRDDRRAGGRGALEPRRGGSRSRRLAPERGPCRYVPERPAPLRRDGPCVPGVLYRPEPCEDHDPVRPRRLRRRGRRGRLAGPLLNVDALTTPVETVDLDAVERNMRRMQDYCDQPELDFRPHIKTHKLPPVAHMQVKAGAVGITCQKLGEAEVMAAAGLDDILITFPL